MKEKRKDKNQIRNFTMMTLIVCSLCINAFFATDTINHVNLKPKVSDELPRIVSKADAMEKLVIEIDEHPIEGNYIYGQEAVPLRAKGHVDGKPNQKITYKWYVNDKPSLEGVKEIPNTDSTSYTPPVDQLGTKYYYAALGSVGVAGLMPVYYYGMTKMVKVTVHKKIETPRILTHPTGATYKQNASAKALSVISDYKAGDDYSYQWYKTTNNGNAGGTVIQGATTPTYKPSTTTAGTMYYYVQITSKGYNQSKKVVSNPAKVVVEKTADIPIIKTQPKDVEVVRQSKGTTRLQVEAVSSDGGTLSYRWFWSLSGKMDKSSDIELNEGTNSYYDVPINLTGKEYYYVEITNTLGNQSASIDSNLVTVDTYRAKSPSITKNLVDGDYYLGDKVEPLSVKADSPDGGSLSYQWYVSDTNSINDGVIIPKATSTTYTPDISKESNKYYFVRITNKFKDDTAIRDSSIARVRVRKAPSKPKILTQPNDVEAIEDSNGTGVSVVAEVSDGGKMSYQWYELESKDATTKTKLTDGRARSKTYYPSTSALGVRYFQVVITNELNDATAMVESDVVAFKVTTKAPLPTITEQPQSATYGQGAKAKTLTTKANVAPGIIRYTWLKSKDKKTWEVVKEDTTSGYTPKTDEIGLSYYRAEVRNYYGLGHSMLLSDIATIEVVKAASTPTITKQPESKIYGQGALAKALEVSAKVEDGGALSYQWYENTTKSNTGGKKLYQTTESLPVTTEQIGSKYYYVEVTNTLHGTQQTIASDPVEIKVVNKASKPTIDKVPENAIYEIHEPAEALEIIASSIDEGSLSYQWYVYDTVTGEEKKPIEGEISKTYVPDTSKLGEKAYAVEVTNNLYGTKANVISEKVIVEVVPATGKPIIDKQPSSAIYGIGATPRDLTVGVVEQEGYVLSYQWFKNDENTMDGASLIEGANKSSYSPSVETKGTTFYFVKVTNTQNKISKSTLSNLAKVEVVDPVGTPTFEKQPEDATYGKDAVASPLTVEVRPAKPNTRFSYQWYKKSKNQALGSKVVGATKASYIPTTRSVTESRYYVEVTATRYGTSETITSDEALIRVVDAAMTPVIEKQPENATYGKGATALPLTVKVQAETSTTLNYQWYKKEVGQEAGVAIAGATKASYMPSTTTVSETNYYVEVTAERYGTSASLTSNEATVHVIDAASVPVIEKHPEGAIYGKGATAAPLAVKVQAVENTTFTYQWYKKVEGEHAGSKIENATEATYKPTTSTVDTTNYYVEVKAERYGTSASLTSNEATVNVVNAAGVPVIEKHPEGTTYGKGATATPLAVKVRAEENTTIHYQWYQKPVGQSKIKITGATEATYMPTTVAVSEMNYYVEVTAERYGTRGIAKSKEATIRVVDAAMTPVIEKQPKDATYGKGASATPLAVEVRAVENTTFTYQWYKKEVGESSGTKIEKATEATYTPTTSTVATTNYYIEVTAERYGTSASLTSNEATIQVIDVASVPVIEKHPEGATYGKGATAAPLAVKIQAVENTTFTYQWYKKETGQHAGSKIENATEATYKPTTSTVGTTNYYVEVKAERYGTVASLTSNEATVNVVSAAGVPVIEKHPEGTTYGKGATATPLAVKVRAEENTTIHYQWYQKPVGQSKIKITGATEATYMPTTVAVSETNYYVEVTAERYGTRGIAKSKEATIRVVDAAMTPVIEKQPKDATYGKGASATPLAVEVRAVENTTFTYQWYKKEVGESSGTKIEKATEATYTPTTSTVGTTNYYIEVTAERYGTSASLTSKEATIQVIDAASDPVIEKHPKGATYGKGATAAPLAVKIQAVDNTTFTYQWYKKETGQHAGSKIEKATEATYTPTTSTVGTTNYYVEVKAERYGTSASLTSNEATVNVVSAAGVPVIEKHPEAAIYGKNASAIPLVVEASNENRGELSYQWYKNEVDDTTTGTRIKDANATSYIPDTEVIGTFYYYVKVSNTYYGTSVDSVSRTAKVDVLPAATKPILENQPSNMRYIVNEQAKALKVSAKADDGGQLSYQWYQSMTGAKGSWKAIEKANAESFVPDTSAEGEIHYYVEITNTLHGTHASIVSDTVLVTTVKPAKKPEITKQPQAAKYFEDDHAMELLVEAKSTDGGLLSYQWYESKSKNFKDAQMIDGATDARYLPSTAKSATTYYGVKVTNTRKGEKASIASELVAVEVVKHTQVPVIVNQPTGATYIVDEQPVALEVRATNSDHGTLAYQWYEKMAADQEDVQLEANGTSFLPDTTTLGARQYYVLVSNTLNNETKTVKSDVVTIQVIEEKEEEGLPIDNSDNTTNVVDNNKDNTSNKDKIDGNGSKNNTGDELDSMQNETSRKSANDQKNDLRSHTKASPIDSSNKNEILQNPDEAKTNDKTNQDKQTFENRGKRRTKNMNSLLSSHMFGFGIGSIIILLLGFFFFFFFLLFKKKKEEAEEENTNN
ncbi:hypothetical protein A4S06_10535 [Erysipelotrichaceae bacterium MTC7]|nr:hypothetical protein A4S06_10535 [Erysipelotrichaceae bacterium MTC7]